jgi:hypothetical protein
MYHVWHDIRVKRYDDEPEQEYQRRRDEVVFITDGFRHGRFTGEVAEQMDRRLSDLLSGAAEFDDKDAHDLKHRAPPIRPAQVARRENAEA